VHGIEEGGFLESVEGGGEDTYRKDKGEKYSKRGADGHMCRCN
jgi:hypothetical protein